ncbi:box C D snoRNA 1 [Labeo rohita]|uniref:Box C D snoRNA 1 n=1 Tax=Labeo rohita TaxID=84645 RepID=A0A498LYP6_LABRO|nr:box C D snoRNA 1 [Labeo rohita]
MLPVMDNSDKGDDDRRGVKRKMALSSLACVKQHKMGSGCSGVRDKTAFVSLSEFSEINLLSDYRFLEDTARLTQQSNRDAVLVSGCRHPKEGMWMIRKARAVKVTLKFLPKVFSKHQENSTIFRRVEGRFYWHLKIHFPQSDAVYSERCPDNRELDQILNDYIHPSESDPVKRQMLKVYVHSPQEHIRVFLKSEQTQPNSLRYLELDLKKTLQENLMHKTIVEYPEIFVVLKEHSQEYLARRPERSSAAQDVSSGNISRTSCSSAKTQSEALVHVAKKPKISEDDELEDGELRSEEEDESTEDEDVVNDDTEKKIPVMHEDEDETDDEELQGNENLEVEMKDCPPHNNVEDAQVDDGNQNKVDSVNITSKTEDMTVSQDPEEAHNNETLTNDDRSQCEDIKLDVSPHGCQENIISHAGLPEDDGVQDKNAERDANHDQEGKFIMSSSCERSDTSQIKGQENVLEENTNVYLNESENQGNM